MGHIRFQIMLIERQATVSSQIEAGDKRGNDGESQELSSDIETCGCL